MKEGQEVRRLKEELDKDSVCRRFYLTYIANTLQRKPWKCLKTLELEDK